MKKIDHPLLRKEHESCPSRSIPCYSYLDLEKFLNLAGLPRSAIITCHSYNIKNKRFFVRPDTTWDSCFISVEFTKQFIDDNLFIDKK